MTLVASTRVGMVGVGSRSAAGTTEETQAPRRWRTIAVGVILGAGILGVATQTLQSSYAATRHPTGTLSYHYRRGYYVDHGWLCYGWPGGKMYHCTAWWHQQGSHYVSDNPAWVPKRRGYVEQRGEGTAIGSDWQ